MEKQTKKQIDFITGARARARHRVLAGTPGALRAAAAKHGHMTVVEFLFFIRESVSI